MTKKQIIQKPKPVNSYMKLMAALSEKMGVEITTEKLFDVALEEVVRIDDKTIKKLWGTLKKDVMTEGVENYKKSPQKVYVRGHGRNGSGNDDLIEILKAVFKRDFQIDRANNTRPDSILKKIIPGEFEDYQISHLFEHRTNNPFLFEAPWMVCYVPKILDPFTGHEIKGFPKLTERFVRWAFKTNKEYINDYNDLVLEYWNKLKDHFNSNTNHYKGYRTDSLILAFAPLILKFEQLPQSERKKAYVKMFKDNDLSYWKMFTKENQFLDKYGQSI